MTPGACRTEIPGHAGFIRAPDWLGRGPLMPIEFPHVDIDGKPYGVAYYSVEEAASRLHVSRPTLRNKLRRGLWPHLNMSGRYYLSDAQLARIVEILTVDPDELGTEWRRGEDDRRLGLVVDDDEAEGGVR